MNFKPSDFFISLMEFFSIFLPGFIIAFLFRNEFLSIILTKEAIINTSAWTAYYFVASYIFGHFVYGTGGFFLEALRPFRMFFVKRWEVKKAVEIMHDQFKSIRENEINVNEKKARRKEIMWLQKWADSVIQIKHPDLSLSIKQYEADAKFFRSFFVVSLWGLLHSIWSQDKGFPSWYWLIGAVVSILLHFYWKYEAIKEASSVIVTMDSLGEFQTESFNKKTINPISEK